MSITRPRRLSPQPLGNRGPLPHHCPGSFSKTVSTKRDKKLAMTHSTCLTGEKKKNTYNTKPQTPITVHSTNQHTHISHMPDFPQKRGIFQGPRTSKIRRSAGGYLKRAGNLEPYAFIPLDGRAGTALGSKKKHSALKTLR